MTDLNDLARRCEEGSGSDRELEMEIVCHFELVPPNKTPLPWLMCFTESLDAAVSFVERALPGFWWRGGTCFLSSEAATEIARLRAELAKVKGERDELSTLRGAARAWCKAKGLEPDFHWDGMKTWQKVALVETLTEDLKAALAEEEDDHRKTEARAEAAEARALAAEARMGEVVKTLEPFAIAADFFPHGADDSDVCVRQAGSGRHYTDMFKLGDFRRAAAIRFALVKESNHGK